ncbi:MAG: DUF3352 domain-containing protein [Blastococcus sp.]
MPPAPPADLIDETTPELPDTSHEPVPPRRRRRRVVIGVVVVAALLVGGVGYAVTSYLSGGGTQPEQVLPGNAIAFAKVDLDPAAGQKIAFYNLLKQFPDLTGKSGNIKDDVAGSLLGGSNSGYTYNRDIAPWIGDRMAIAAISTPGKDATTGIRVAPLLALQIGDKDKMNTTLAAARRRTHDFGYAVRDDYVLIADTQQTADQAAAAKDTLASSGAYASDLAALHGDQVAVGWADLTAVKNTLAAIPSISQNLPTGPTGLAGLTGRVILGIHAENHALEATGLTRGMPTTTTTSTPPTRLIGHLPAGTTAALAVSGLGKTLTNVYTGAGNTGPLAGISSQADAVGLTLPADLNTIFGTDFVIGALDHVTSNPQIGLRVTSPDGTRALSLLNRLIGDQGGLPVAFAPAPGGYTGALNARTGPDAFVSGHLGDTPAFRAAVPDPDTAQAVGYVNLAALITELGTKGGATATEAHKFTGLDALGFTVTITPDGARLTLRIVTR